MTRFTILITIIFFSFNLYMITSSKLRKPTEEFTIKEDKSFKAGTSIIELKSGQFAESPNKVLKLEMRASGELMLSKNNENIFLIQNLVVDQLKFDSEYGMIKVFKDGFVKWMTYRPLKDERPYRLILSDDKLCIYNKYDLCVYNPLQKVEVTNNNIIHTGVKISRLEKNQFVFSPNGKFRLTLNNKGNVVLTEGNKLLWETNTKSEQNYSFFSHYEGSVRIAGMDLNWSSKTTVKYEEIPLLLLLQDDGNLVLYKQKGIVWKARKI